MGWLTVLFHDAYGSYLIQQSDFHRDAYARFFDESKRVNWTCPLPAAPFDLGTFTLQDSKRTQDEIQEFLGLKDYPLETMDEYNSAINALLNVDTNHMRQIKKQYLQESDLEEKSRLYAGTIQAYNAYMRLSALISDLFLARLALQFKDEPFPEKAIGNYIGSQAGARLFDCLPEAYANAALLMIDPMQERIGVSYGSLGLDAGNYVYYWGDYPRVDDIYDPMGLIKGWREKYNSFCKRVEPLFPHMFCEGRLDTRYADTTKPHL